MTRFVLMIIMLAACFLAMALSLALELHRHKKVLRIAMVTTGLIGSVLYGYGYAQCYGLNAVSILRALVALCRMFTGSSDLSSIKDAPLMKNNIVLTIFWIGHFLGFYVTASAFVTALGDWLLRRIRITRLSRRSLLLVYGINANSVAFARRTAAKKAHGVLFVDSAGGKDFESAIKAFGGIIEKSSEALEASQRFLHQINITPGKRQLEVAALHSDGKKNLDYCMALMESLKKAGIGPEQTSLLIAGVGEASNLLQAPDGGFGSVMAFDDYDLTARVIVNQVPPCNMIRFDGKGSALEDLHIVIVGFGQMGRAIFSHMLANGQFHGSHFRADIFDPSPQKGFMHGWAGADKYDIRFHTANGTSEEFYTFLDQEQDSIRCVALCTGSKQENEEIAADLENLFHTFTAPPVIIQTIRGEYSYKNGEQLIANSSSIYENAILDISRIDAMAREINGMYLIGGSSSAQAWNSCDYYSRMSSRASADFYPAFLRASGRTAEQVLAGDWPPDEETVECLAITEHLRWCAYMYLTGFALMPETVYAQRSDLYARLKKEGKKPDFAIGKDTQNRLHACLIPWDELDTLSARENAVTGGSVDYKQLDRNNVLALARVLAAVHPDTESKHHG